MSWLSFVKYLHKNLILTPIFRTLQEYKLLKFEFISYSQGGAFGNNDVMEVYELWCKGLFTNRDKNGFVS